MKVKKSLKISDIADHSYHAFSAIMPKCPDVNFEYFIILLKENNEVKLHLKEPLLIKCNGSHDLYLLFKYILLWANYPCNFN